MKKGIKRLVLFVLCVLLILTAAAGCSALRGSTDEKMQDVKGKLGAAKEKIEENAGKLGKEGAEKLGEASEMLGKATEKLGKAANIIKEITLRHSKSKRQFRSAKDLELIDVTGAGVTYRFKYGDEEITAEYTPDNWKVYDSYKVLNSKDIEIICQALIDIHPVHGKDLKSYRTAKDMAYEWQQHNIMYDVLPDGNRWKQSAKDVDLDPYDQDKSYKELYEDRTGKKFDIKDFI